FFSNRNTDGCAPRNGSPRPLDITDADLIEKARRARNNGDKFRRLWDGDRSGYVSASEADAALVNYLIFWTGGNFERVVDLFAQSGLYRSKWNREDYQRRTFDLAMKGRGPKDFYESHARRTGKHPASGRLPSPDTDPPAEGGGSPPPL